jgi:mannose-6-phosphate isomerase-like protein (cupin superfamily)
MMNILRQVSAPRYQRDHIVSYLLASERTCQAQRLTITLVEMEPGGVQHVHAHAPEQMYYILEGAGLMTVNAEQRPVQVGDCIFFSAFDRHGLQNTDKTVLRYLSAASPSFTAEECQQFWPLASLAEEQGDQASAQSLGWLTASRRKDRHE